MATQLMFYESAVPMSVARHGRHSVQAGADYSFARGINSIPVVAAEFAAAARDHSIVFAGPDDAPMPFLVLGLQRGQNLYVGADGRWNAHYVPAFARRYPFVFAMEPDGERAVLCVDESFPGLNTEGRGQRLFGDDGKPSEYTSNMMKFLQDYQSQVALTRRFGQRLAELKLLDPMQAQLTGAGGERAQVTGFKVVSRERLKQLDGAVLSELARSDGLELLFLHLQSLGNFNELRDRFARIAAAQPAAATAQ
jgi:hypothetical protein